LARRTSRLVLVSRITPKGKGTNMRTIVVVLFAGVVCIASACSAQDSSAPKAEDETNPSTESKALPEKGSIPAGEYTTEEFEPSLSFRLEGQGWKILPPSSRDALFILKDSPLGLLGFLHISRIFDEEELSKETQKPAPDDLVAWIEHHPYLDASRPEQAPIGGVKGQQIEVTAARMPVDHPQFCSDPCVPLFALGTRENADNFWLYPNEKVRFIVLEDVEGKTVALSIDSTTEEFEAFLPEAENVLDTVTWEDDS
jgi:hypothetical protein